MRTAAVWEFTTSASARVEGCHDFPNPKHSKADWSGEIILRRMPPFKVYGAKGAKNL